MTKKTSDGSNITKYLSSNDTIGGLNSSKEIGHNDIFEDSQDSEIDSMSSLTIKTVSEKEMDPEYKIDQKNILGIISPLNEKMSHMSCSSIPSHPPSYKGSELENSIEEDLNYDPPLEDLSNEYEEECKEYLECVSDAKSDLKSVNLLSSDCDLDMSSVNLSKFDYVLSLDSEIKDQINCQQNIASRNSFTLSYSAGEGESESL
mmetsp:Transcript_8879/g.7858  ORF Transcript_8879/g.7858 Transcript_8879/m.7858 type:complete len:204 (-) Transcript_8879:92-703(-)